MKTSLSKFLKKQRKSNGLNQRDLALKVGVGLRFIRNIEQGKKTIRIDKVNSVLRLFGYELFPQSLKDLKKNNQV